MSGSLFVLGWGKFSFKIIFFWGGGGGFTFYFVTFLKKKFFCFVLELY